MKILLVNSNLMRPPITPIALDLLAESLESEGFNPVLLDLAWSGDPFEDIEKALQDDYLFAAVSIRNTDDCFYPGSDECLLSHQAIISALKTRGLRVAAGGVGFSVNVEAAARFLDVDFAIQGDGELAIVALARALAGKDSLQSVPGLLGINPPKWVELDQRPPLARAFVDNLRYQREGGQVGFETKRGCPHRCLACTEPRVKGRRVRLVDPESVAAELSSLASRGIEIFHTCDSEFNEPHDHALSVCRAFIDCGVSAKIQWYAYCTPAGFNDELAEFMARAGCVGINFTVDHGDPEGLARLRCPHTVDDIRRSIKACRAVGIRTMCDLLLGAPGETRTSIQRTIELMRELSPTKVGVSFGVRLYSQCSILDKVELKRDNPSLHAKVWDRSLLRPVFYQEASLGDDVREWLAGVIGGDPRFFYSATVHNYDGHPEIERLIQEGARGAYWDILARGGKVKGGC
ncbi:B12-binding domain-containing radical SAM protein [Acidobacteriota bacterium]